MKVIASNTQFKVEYNGGNTWFIVDNNGDCWASKTTERQAMNYFNKASKMCGIS